MQSVKNNVTVPPAHPSLQVTPEADPETLGFPGEEAIPGDTGRWWSSDTEGNQPGEGCDQASRLPGPWRHLADHVAQSLTAVGRGAGGSGHSACPVHPRKPSGEEQRLAVRSSRVRPELAGPGGWGGASKLCAAPPASRSRTSWSPRASLCHSACGCTPRAWTLISHVVLLFELHKDWYCASSTNFPHKIAFPRPIHVDTRSLYHVGCGQENNP